MWIVDLLSKVPDSFVKGEIFLEKSPGKRKKKKTGSRNYKSLQKFHEFKAHNRLFAVSRYFDLLESEASGSSLLCFKLMYSQIIKNPGTLLELKKRGYKIIHLTRRSSLDVSLSRAVSKSTGQARVRSEDAFLDAQITLNPRMIVLQAKSIRVQRAVWSRLIDWFFLEKMTLEYEAMVQNLDAQLRTIERFCGFSENTVPGESTMIKLGGARYAKMITNYPEVMAAAQKSGIT